MNRIERWDMYYEIQRLKQIGLKISQISRKMDISRNTVYKYLNMTLEEVDQEQQRWEKLNVYSDEIVKWLKAYPDLSASQVEDWLKEHHPGEIDVCESTVRNFVREMRKKHNIPKVVHRRDYESVDDPPMGQQMQVDFGETKLRDQKGKWVKLWFIAFVLANSRYKYVEWLNRPFTTMEKL